MSPKKSPTRVRRSSTPEFEHDAVRLVEKGRTVTEVARDLGIARSLLQYWKRQLDAEGDCAQAPATAGASDADRLRKLEKELRDVREERDILKKALAYFADDQK